MTLDAPAIRGAYQPPHVTGNSLDRLPLTCRRIRWFCAWTDHHRERIAETAIRAAGFEAFLPLYLQVRSFGRSDIVPCFSRYVFCRFNASRDDWGRITAARGVNGLICHGPGLPTPLPDFAMTELMIRTSPRGVVDDPGDRTPYDGATAGYRPIWQDMTGMDAGSRQRLLIRLFGASASRIVTEDAA